jgi:hypothetical protein
LGITRQVRGTVYTIIEGRLSYVCCPRNSPAIERLDAPAEGTPDDTASIHVRELECGSETLRIDTQLFNVQRELLTKITELARKNEPFSPASGDAQLLEGLLELTDTLSDMIQAGRS